MDRRSRPPRARTFRHRLCKTIYKAKYTAAKAGPNFNVNHAGAKVPLHVGDDLDPRGQEHVSGAEIGATDGDNWNMFLDGWGHPICWLRWAPGFTQYSDIQIQDPPTGSFCIMTRSITAMSTRRVTNCSR